MKPIAEMDEGPRAFTRFRQALEAVLAVPESAMQSEFVQETHTQEEKREPKG